VLNVETDRVDSAVGTGKCGLHAAFVMCVGGDLFDAIVLGAPLMPRDYAHLGADLVQIAHDATTYKAGPARGEAPFVGRVSTDINSLLLLLRRDL
jgi:hypothetical protein